MNSLQEHKLIRERAGGELDAYLEAFESYERQAVGREPSWLTSIRKAGIAAFAEAGLPASQDEDWRYTSLAPLKAMRFTHLPAPVASNTDRERIASLPHVAPDEPRLVFLNGYYSEELSHPPAPAEGIILANLASAFEGDQTHEVSRHLARHAMLERQPFTALNTALFADGALIVVRPGRRAERPVHLVFLNHASQAGEASLPRNLVFVGRGGELTVIETHVGYGEHPGFTNAVTEIVTEPGARVEHCRIQDETAATCHLSTLHADLADDVSLATHSFALGARLSRHQIHACLGGRNAEALLNGLYLAGRDQLADHFMTVDHAEPHTTSHEYFNGIFTDRAKGVFHGRIHVRPPAQKTDAKQTNKSLLLSPAATISTKPQLEIYADDVKCTHGATVGQLDRNSIFYLRARGIDEATARQMLIHAFAGEIVERIAHRGLRERLDSLLWQRLEDGHFIG